MRSRSAPPAPADSDVIAHLTEVFRRIADGDFEARVQALPDRAGDAGYTALRTEINRTIDRLDGFVRETNGALDAAKSGRLYRQFLTTGLTGTFATTARNVDEARATMSRYAQETESARDMRRTLADEFDTTIGRIAEQVAAAATQLSAAAAGLAQSSDSAVSEAERARGTVATLEERSQQIERVVAVISTVAAQTKLLALNATIEAARAGEAGRGFAVVADEVKQLAEQTRTAAEEIVDQVRAVQQVAADSSAVMAGIGATIRSMGELTAGVSAAVDGGGGASAGGYDEARGLGLASMTTELRSQSDRFLAAMRSA